MAEDQGIHPEVMRHIVDLHRKHSEMQMQMHDKEGGEPHEVFQQMLDELKKLNEHLAKMIPAIEADTKADKGEGKENGNARRRRERDSPAAVSGKSTPSA
jgi:phage host-nuclease inhibitor protein Gam